LLEDWLERADPKEHRQGSPVAGEISFSIDLLFKCTVCNEGLENTLRAWEEREVVNVDTLPRVDGAFERWILDIVDRCVLWCVVLCTIQYRWLFGYWIQSELLKYRIVETNERFTNNLQYLRFQCRMKKMCVPHYYFGSGIEIVS